ncbi:hypothetical protein GQ44DRAFT_757375 [Phaeosphaeriaceae sp. PMI808]|nr:hypothetical protein GQ44DRAFT_757375 [Phaeosphaeriaceae sp. PMI808]
MENSYYNSLSSPAQYGATQHTMAPPLSLSSTLYQPAHVNQNQPLSYVGRGPLSPSNIYLATVGHQLQPSNHPFPLNPPSSALEFGNPSGSSVRHIRSSAQSQKPPGRTTAITSDAWIKNKATIHKLWIEEDRPLPETMAIMSGKHHFQASLDQYKKQISKWKWSKYIPAKAGGWMLWKADQRKRDEGKDTAFEYRGQLLTKTTIQTRIDRKTVEGNLQVPSDVETPRDIEYMTPQNPIRSPLGNPSVSVRIAQPTWTPPADPNQGRPRVRLVWNGHTKAYYQTLYEEGLADELSRRPEDAEAKFRSALDGFHYLLSTTHPDTVTVAYRLASFFAEHVRMQEADTVLDWLTHAHLEAFGISNTKTLNHTLNMCEMFRNWGRPGDSAEFVQQIFRESEKRRPQSNDVQPSTVNTDPLTLPTNAGNMTTTSEQELNPQFPIPLEGSTEPSSLQAQINLVTSGSQVGESAEAVLLRLIRHCEQFPDKLIAHSLLCYPALLDHYENVEDVVKRSHTLGQAEHAIWKVLHSKKQKTKDDLIGCLQLAKYLVKASKYESADDIFSQIECDAQEIFGSDHLTTIWFLENIGTCYQNEGRWQDAAPRFEHALAARLSLYGAHHESVRRLEAALENHHFEIYVPSKNEEIFPYTQSGRPILRISGPEFALLGLRLRGRQTDSCCV